MGKEDGISNYLKKYAEIFKELNLETDIYCRTVVSHDPWCDFVKGKGICNCNPEIKIISKDEIGRS